MPSSYDNELGVELQAAGENLNTWGQPKLNNALKRLVKGVAGFIEKPLTGDITLTSSNSSTDPNDFEARHAAIKFTGTGTFVVTAPSSPKSYVIWNACTGPLTVTTGVGDVASVAPGERCQVQCDGVNVFKVRVVDYGAELISSSGAPISGNHLVNKSYVDGVAFNSTDLPGQGPGTAGKFVKSDGSVASWSGVHVGDVADAASINSPEFSGISSMDDVLVRGFAKFENNITVHGDLRVDGEVNFSGGSFPSQRLLSRGAISNAQYLNIDLSETFSEHNIYIRDLVGYSKSTVRGIFSFDGGATFKSGSGEYIFQYYWQQNSGFISGGLAQAVNMMLGENVDDMIGNMDMLLRVITGDSRESRIISDWSQVISGDALNSKSGRHSGSTNGKGYGRATNLRIFVNSGSMNCSYSVYGVP